MKMIILFIVFCRSITPNVLGLGEVGDFEAPMFNLALLPPFCQTLVSGSAFNLGFGQ